VRGDTDFASASMAASGSDTFADESALRQGMQKFGFVGAHALLVYLGPVVL